MKYYLKFITSHIRKPNINNITNSDQRQSQRQRQVDQAQPYSVTDSV